MLLLQDNGHPYLIDSVTAPVAPKHCWFYDSEQNDYMLKAIRLLEETTGPTVRIRVNKMEFNVPASWNMMVVDDETRLVDTVPITMCSSSNYKAYLMHPDHGEYGLSSIQLLDLYPKEACVHVTIPRGSMLLHPVGTYKGEGQRGAELSFSCLLSPQDLGKHLHGVTAIDISV
jgi:hypothetical protein